MLDSDVDRQICSRQQMVCCRRIVGLVACVLSDIRMQLCFAGEHGCCLLLT